MYCRELESRELHLAVDIATRAMLSNPPFVAIYGSDRSRRERGAKRIFRAVLGTKAEPPLAAFIDGRAVGVLGVDPPGTCMPPLGKKLRMLSQLIRMGTPLELYRGLIFIYALRRNDLEESHWHVGPVAVEPELQGKGIGSKRMQVLCAQVDRVQEVAFLETEKAENVCFYEGFGFQVVNEDEPLGITQWYMRRFPSGAAG